MAQQYTNISRKQLGRGIDSFSAKGSLKEGYAEDLQNVDTSSSGKLTTRKGFEGYFGWIPLRVTQVTHDGTAIRFQFSSANVLDLSTTLRGPLIVYGRLSSEPGDANDFGTTDAVRYYPYFSITSRDALSLGSGTLTKTSSQHGYTSQYFWTGLAQADSVSTLSNNALIPEDVAINTSTYAVSLDYVTTAAGTGFVYFRDMTAASGSVYTGSLSPASATTTASNSGGDLLWTDAAHGLSDGDAVEFTTSGTLPTGTSLTTNYYVVSATTDTFKLATARAGTAITYTDAGTGTHTWNRRSYSVSAGTHGLDNFNILVKVFDTALSAGEATEVIPDEWLIDSAGKVTVEFTADVTGYVTLARAPLTQAITTSATVSGGGPTTNTLTISSPGGEFLFFNAYRRTGTVLESVLVQDWTYDSATDEVTIEYVVSGTAGEAIEIYWLTGSVISNVAEVTDTGSVSTSYTDTAPQLTVWGIDHAGSYRRSTSRGGHVSHIDSYRRLGEGRVVAGLGGNLFSATTYAEGATTYNMTSRVVDLSARVEGDTLLAPLFHTTNPGSVRTRGVVYDDSVESHKTLVSAATYVSSGVVDYTLTFTNKSATVSIGSQISTSDLLTVSGMAHDEHNGDWTIQSVVSQSSTELVLRVANSSITSDFFDETGAAGRAGVFTDTFAVESAPNFIATDRLLSSAIDTSLTVTISSVSSTTVYVKGVTDELSLPDGLSVFVRRTTSVVPLTSTSSGSADVEGLVRGDMLTVTDLDRRVRVLNVLTQSNQTITVDSSDGTTATCSTPSAHRLNAGQKILLTGGSTSVLNGEHTVSSVVSDTVFTFASTTSAAATATLQGKCVELDEELTVTDGNSPTTFTVDGRWVPVEAPDNTYDITATTWIQHFDSSEYDEQSVLRSASINDSLYLTNYNDEVMKFDGTNLVRAGLPEWQYGLFVHEDTAASASLSVGQTIAYTAKDDAGKYFTVAANNIEVGDRLYDSVSDATFLVTSVAADSSSTYRVTVRASDDISGAAASGTLKRVLTYKYYVRLNYLDANNFLIGSAALQSEDLVLDYTQSGSVQIKLVRVPGFDNYDFHNLEVELYRTRANGQQFFLHTRQLVGFTFGSHYLLITDSLEDESINPGGGFANTDSIHSALLGVELGTAWQAPPRAKHITSTNSRLVLGNVRGLPEASLLLRPEVGADTITTSNLAGKRLLFRKDSADTATTTDMTNRVAFEFVSTPQASSTFSVDSATDVANASDLFTETAHGLVTGDTVQITGTTGGVPTGLALNTTYYVVRINADTFKLATNAKNAFAGTVINITSDGTGVQTFTKTTAGNVINPTAITTGGSSFVVTSTAHGLAAGDWVYLFHSGKATTNSLEYSGWFQLASVTTDTFAINVNNLAAATAADVDRYVTATAQEDIPVWIGNSGLDGNYSQRDGNSTGDDEALTAALRLAGAVNASQRCVDTGVNTTFVPWLSAFAGNNYRAGEVLVKIPYVLSTTPEVVLPSSLTGIRVFINDRTRLASEQVSFQTVVLPSRLVVSYPNHPEIFDNPLGDVLNSDSAIDINSADGQEITGVIPFFGQSATGSNVQLNQEVVVFKTNSIYLVNVDTKQVQRIDSRGLGCTAPRSISVTHNGVTFANQSGIYKLNRDMTVSHVGLLASGLWKSTVNRDSLAEATGHHYAVGRRYKLSVPTGSGTYPDQVFVYDYDAEESNQLGAWTRYTNHAATGWCNLDNDAYWGSQYGDVFLVRNRGEASDYRDEASAVAEQVILLGAEDFGVPGIRKVVASVATLVELDSTDITDLVVSVAQNLSRTFTTASTVEASRDDYQQVTYRTSLPFRRGTHVQVKYTHNVKDEELVLTGVEYRVGQLTDSAVKEAQNLT